jgi:hypothetical protein
MLKNFSPVIPGQFCVAVAKQFWDTGLWEWSV